MTGRKDGEREEQEVRIEGRDKKQNRKVEEKLEKKEKNEKDEEN